MEKASKRGNGLFKKAKVFQVLGFYVCATPLSNLRSSYSQCIYAKK